MAEEDRVVFPEEVEEIKTKAVEEVVEAKEASSETQAPTEASGMQMRNMIVVPSNCPPGFVKGADGVCREVF